MAGRHRGTKRESRSRRLLKRMRRLFCCCIPRYSEDGRRTPASELRTCGDGDVCGIPSLQAVPAASTSVFVPQETASLVSECWTIPDDLRSTVEARTPEVVANAESDLSTPVSAGRDYMLRELAATVAAKAIEDGVRTCLEEPAPITIEQIGLNFENSVDTNSSLLQDAADGGETADSLLSSAEDLPDDVTPDATSTDLAVFFETHDSVMISASTANQAFCPICKEEIEHLKSPVITGL